MLNFAPLAVFNFELTSSYVQYMRYFSTFVSPPTPDSPALSLSALLVRIGIAIITIPDPAQPYFIRYCSS